jgi:hypothetical protein
VTESTFVLRLIDCNRRVLAWARVRVEPRGDGALYATTDFLAVGVDTGTAVAVIWHWPDVNIHGTVNLPAAVAVVQGERVDIGYVGQPVLTMASDPRPLPPVTETRAVTTEVPTGVLSAAPSLRVH